MNIQPTPEPNYGPVQIDETSPEIFPEQLLSLKLETEQLHRNVDRLSRLLQTLLTGLLIATLVATGIASWFAYRLLVQENIARKEAEKTAATQLDIQERLEQLEGQFQSQNKQVQELTQQVENLNQQAPEELRELIEKNQQQLELLRERLEQIEAVE